MMKRKSLKKWRKNAMPGGAPNAAGRALMLIDEGPIRAAAVKDCRKAMRELEKARAKLEDFERMDQPAFARWYHATFGAELSRIREWKEKIEGMERLIEEIESVRDERGIGYHAAYEYVMERRSHPERYERNHEDPRYDGAEEDGEEEWDPFWESDEEEERSGDGMDADAGSDEELLFEAFLEFAAQDPVLFHFLEDRNVMRVLFAQFRKKLGNRTGRKKRFDDPPAAKAPPLRNRIKSLYRALVKRLHPDFRPREDAHRDELWHRVQAAYAQGDAEGLETLTALCDIHIDKSFATGSVSSIRAVVVDQREQLAALKKRMRSAKKDPAWGFAKNPEIAEFLGPQIRGEMEFELGMAQGQYESYEATVGKWSVARPRKNARRQAIGRQAEFGF